MILVTAGEMQAIDRRTIESFGLPGRVLMENAGRGASQILLEQFSGVKDRPVGVMAGRGNNGGDGFVIARCLHQQGIRVVVYLLANRQRVKGDAADNLELLQPLGVPVVEIPDENTFNRHKQAMTAIDIWVDAILGTGLKSTVKGYFQTVIDFINSQHRPVLAVDIASGLDSDTGQICGTCIRAAATATFGFAKTGQMLQPGVHWTGNLEVIDIGIPPFMISSSLVGVIAQRLVRVICPDCKEEYIPNPELLSRISMRQEDLPFKFYRGAGCPKCNNTGFKGRTAIEEIMILGYKVRELIQAGASADALREAAMATGMTTLGYSGLQKIREGITTIEEVLRAVYQKEELTTICSNCGKAVSLDFKDCPFCKHPLVPTCGSCNRIVQPEWVVCPYCRNDLKPNGG